LKIYVITGEKSGDQHAGDLLAQLHILVPNLEIRGVGGEAVQQAGGILLKHYQDLAVMGFWEVVKRLGTIRKQMAEVKRDLLAFQPDLLLLVDFAGFNLRIARFAKKHRLKVSYFIAPKAWAWNSGRAKTLAESTDQVLVILPFELNFFKRYRINVHYVGNPSREQVDQYLETRSNSKALLPKRIALLPGSRIQEIRAAIEVFNELPGYFPEYTFVMAGVSNVPAESYRGLNPVIVLAYDQAYDLMRSAEAAIVTSGTASLECALLDVPHVVVYRTSGFSYLIAKQLIRVDFISLVNLLVGREVVKELIQEDFTASKITLWLRPILETESGKQEIMRGYSEMRQILGQKKASQQAARLIHAHFFNA